MKIIGLMGPKRCGKSSIATHLEKNYGYKRISLATPLKNMLKELGLTEEQVNGSLKETPCDLLCGKSPRFAMQTLGTEWARDTIGSDLWVRILIDRVSKEEGDLFVLDDLRFENEVRALSGHGLEIWRINRPQCVPANIEACHPSEKFWSVVDPEVEIDSSNSLDTVFRQVDEIMALTSCI